MIQVELGRVYVKQHLINENKINVLSEIKLNFYNLLLSHWSILENINYFEDNGIKINFFNNSNEDIYKCDILIISSRYFYNNNFSNEYIIDSLKKYKTKFQILYGSI